MRRIFFLFLSCAFFLTTVPPASAILRDDIGYVYGKIIAHDKAKSQIVVNDYYTGEDMTFTIGEEENQVLEKNTEIALTYDLKSKSVKFLRIVEPKY